MTHARLSVLLAIILVLVPGCATQVPDLKPFADSTRKTRTATRASFDALIEVDSNADRNLRTIESRLRIRGDSEQLASTADLRSKFQARLKVLKDQAAYFDRAMSGFVTYSANLRDLSQKARDDIQASKQAASAFSSLVRSLASLSAVPGAPAIAEGVGTLADVAQGVAAAITRERVRAQLLEQVRAQSASITSLTDALVSDLQRLRKTTGLMKSAVAELYNLQDEEQVELVAALNNRLRILSNEMRSKSSGGECDIPEALIAEFETISRTLNAAEDHLQPTYGRIATAQQAVLDADATLAQTIELVRAWAKAHDELPEVIDDNRLSPLEALAEITDQMDTTLGKLRDTLKKLDEAQSKKS